MEHIYEHLVSGLSEIYGELLMRIVLYGSVAKGTDTEESDIDIAVLLKPGETKEMYDRMIDMIVDLELECGKVLSVIRIDCNTFSVWEDTLPFYQNVKKDGVVLWNAA